MAMISESRAGALLRSRGSIWKLSPSWLRDGLGVVGKNPRSNQGGGINRAGRRFETIHSHASFGRAGGSDHDHYKVAVIGAGSAGLAIVSTLLDIGNDSILWIDPHFNAGRLSTYAEVPSNTKVRLFTQFVTTSPSLNRYARQALSQFDSQDADRCCSLSLAVAMVKNLTDCLRHDEVSRVRCSTNLVKEVRFFDGKWHLDTGEVVEQVYLATGSVPSKYDVESLTELHDIDLDVALTPSILRDHVSESDSVGVVGSSHSAILALRNVVNSYNRPNHIINFYRSPLLYAVYMDDDWILHDNTGLKGEVADWARREIDTGNLEMKEIVTRVCVKDCTLDEQIELWRGCTKLIQAVGFSRNALPKIVIDGEEVVNVEYDPLTGRVANGLFGYGIAFPERVIDRHGNRELAVGLWDFMRYARETVPKHALHLSSRIT